MPETWAVGLPGPALFQDGPFGPDSRFLAAGGQPGQAFVRVRHRQARGQRRGPQPPSPQDERAVAPRRELAGWRVPGQGTAGGGNARLLHPSGQPAPRDRRRHQASQARRDTVHVTTSASPETLVTKPATVTTRALLALFWVYKAATANRSPACRFTPSCSEYAYEAVQRFGARRSLPLVAKRLARCRPGGPFGLDPVPDTLPNKPRDLPSPHDVRGKDQ